MEPPKQQRHRPGASKQLHKLHKTGRHRSKRSISNEFRGKTSIKAASRHLKKEMGREARRNQSAQIRKAKRDEALSKKRALGGEKTPPYAVAVIPLSPEVNVIEALNLIERCDSEAVASFSDQRNLHITVPRFKQRYSFIQVAPGDIYSTLDTLKVADTVLFLESAQNWEDGLCAEGELLLTSILAQGLPASVVALVDLEQLPQKIHQKCRETMDKEFSRYLPDDKIVPLKNESDGILLLRKIGSQKQRSITQRDSRPHLLAESVRFVPNEGSSSGTLCVTGYLRGQTLSADRLVHIPGWGTYQLKQIEAPAHDPFLVQKDRKGIGMEEESVTVLSSPNPDSQETLDSENIPDPMEAEQTWPTEEEIAEAEAEYKEKMKKKIKRIPKGMSEYQAAWIPDIEEVTDEENEDDESSDEEYLDAMSQDVSVSGEEEDDNEYETLTVTEGARDDEQYDKNLDLTEEYETLNKIKDARMDAMFPDEIDTPDDVPARERFQRYRGLESFRTSPWDPKENLPSDYARIFQFENFKRTRKRIMSESAEDEGALPGWYITLVIENVPQAFADAQTSGHPVVIYGMLPHEQKMSVVHVVLKRVKQLSFGLQTPIKSKEPLIFHCGYRRFKACPIFSQHTFNNKHKFERFFQPESTVVATVFAPIMFPPANVLVYKELPDHTQQLVATGSVLSCDPDRVIVKRAILSGHPFKVNKRSAVIRYMFFNREDINWFKPLELRTKYGRHGHIKEPLGIFHQEDINWFKPLELRTKYGRHGHIKEPLGTHGHMKCIFNGQIRSDDTVLLNLYKRVFPKWTYESIVSPPPPLFRPALATINEADEDMA